MLFTRILYSIGLGFLFSFAGYFLSLVSLSPSNIVYHTKAILSKRKRLWLIFVIEVVTITIVLLITRDYLILLQSLLSLLIISMIAYSDSIAGRIPLFYLFASVLIGTYLDFLNKQTGIHLLGGLMIFGLMFIFFLLGKKYVIHLKKQNQAISAFGLGDVYTSGVIGSLFGFSRGLIIILLALVMAVVYAAFQSRDKGYFSFFQIRTRLGPFFFISAVVLVLLGYLFR